MKSQRSMPHIALCLLAVWGSACWGIGLPPNTHIQIVALADYTNVYNQPESSNPASVTLTVLQVVGARITWQPPAETVAQGTDFYVPVRITNTGNGADTFDISATSSHGWSAALIYDENADGVHQAEEQWEITNTQLIADGYCQCFVRLHIPPDASTGDIVTVTAASRTAPGLGSASANIDVPPPGMMASHITLAASPLAPIIGQTVTVHGVIAPAIREPIVVTITNPSGASSTASCLPEADGTFITTFTPDQTGTYNIQANYPGGEHYAGGDATLSVVVAGKNATTLSAQAVPSNPMAGSEVVVSGTLTPAMSTTVSLTYQPPSGSITQADARTDQFGHLSHSVRMNTPGQWTVTAVYAGDATNAASSSQLGVTVESERAEHAVTFTTPPSTSPTTVTSPESTQCSSEASDSSGHTVRYGWSDGGAGGTFTPSASVASPVYLAPPNRGSENQTITLRCTAACNEDPNVAVAASTSLTVRPATTTAPSVLSVSPQPGSVLNELGADIVVRFSEPMNQTAARQAITFSPSVVPTGYSWDDTGSVLTIVHQPLTPGIEYTCTISTSAKDSGGAAMESQYQWTFTTVPAVRFEPSDIGALPSSTCATPRAIVSDPTQPANVSFKLTVPAGLVVNDAVDGSGSLVCVHKGADAGDFHSEWDSGRRELSITASVPTPSLSSEIVKSIHIGTPAASGKYEIQVQGTAVLAIQVRDLVPGDFNGDGVINITDAVRFTQEYVRWQADPLPTFDADVDDLYDLAPHTQVAWPDWVKIGDHVIDTQDAAAFQDCWNSAHGSGASSAASAGYSPTLRCSFAASAANAGQIVVTVAKPVNGLFEAVIEIPRGVTFDPAFGPSGSLRDVSRGPGSGTVFFSEYDPATRTVRIAGTVKGAAPYSVAVIALSK